MESTDSRSPRWRLFGDWAGVRGNPTIIGFGDNIDMCLTDNSGSISAADNISARPEVPWFTFRDKIRSSPYDDFNLKALPQILDFLDQQCTEWEKDKLFISQVINTPHFTHQARSSRRRSMVGFES